MKSLLLSLLVLVMASPFALARDTQNVSTILNTDIQTEIKKNEISLINFWATWCTPCIQEIPVLMKVQKEFSQKKLDVVFINLGEDKIDVLKFLKKNKIKINTFYEPTGVSDKLNFHTLPFSFVISKDLEILETIRGGQDFEGFTKILNKYLKAQK